MNVKPGLMQEFSSAIKDAIISAAGQKRQDYLTGTVTSVETNGTIWVDVTGGVRQMPIVRSTVDCKPGDLVSFTIDNGVASIGGNATDISAGRDSVVHVEHEVTTLETKVTIAENLIAEKADIQELNAQKARIVDLEADTAKIHDLTADQLTAATGYIGTLTANSVTANDLISAKATIGTLGATYAQIDLANVNTAVIQSSWIDKLMVQTGLIAHEGAVFTLDAIQVNAANITAGTIDVQRIVVTDQETGEKYLLNTHPVEGEIGYEKLDGNIIQPSTITADHIVSGSVTAEKITTEDIVGSGGWINLRNGTFNYINAETGEGISWDGEHLHVSGDIVVSYANLIDLPSVSDLPGADGYVTTSAFDEGINAINDDIDGLGDDVSELSTAIDDKIAEAKETVDATIAGVDGKVDNLSGQVSNNASRISTAETSISTANANISSLQSTVDRQVTQLANIASFTTIEAGKVTLGLAGSPIKTLLTGEGLSFTAIGQSEPIAYLGVDENDVGKLFVTNAVVVQDLELGDWAWTARKNKHLTLKYIGS